MEFYLDTAFVEEIKEALRWGILDGVTTNPSLVAKTGKSFRQVVKEIAQLVDGPVSAEVLATDKEGMIKQARILRDLAPNVVVKIPFTEEGIQAIVALAEMNIPVNCTLIFSVSQGLMAAKAGARYISPFIGRLDDISHEGMRLVEELGKILDRFTYDTQIVAASIRHPLHVKEAALKGADIVTMPFSVMKKLFHHPLTDKGLERFLKDWENSGLSW